MVTCLWNMIINESGRELGMSEKPDYRDYKISEDIYQKKFVNNEEETLTPLKTHLIYLMLFSTFIYLFYDIIEMGYEISWTEFGDSMGIYWYTGSVILIPIIIYRMFYYYFKMFIEKIGLSWSDEKYERYQNDLQSWRLDKRVMTGVHHHIITPDRQRSKERDEREEQQRIEEENKKREQERLVKKKN